MSEINIIVCNNKIYFDSETISEIRELTEDSDYYPYKMDLDRIEATVNNGRFHNVTEVLNQINFICLAYESDRDSEYLSLEDDEPDNSNLTEHDNKVLDSINKLPDDKLNQEILIHSIARLNKRINMLYGRITKRQTEIQKYIGSSYGLYLQNEIDDYINEQNILKNKRKPILHLLMKAYRLSLDDVKQLLQQADKDKFPTYKTIDNIVDMIECYDFSFE